MPKVKFNLKHRWVKARPGSVLILVIALLVLLALIGTAYLTSTQTERYSSVQNSINTEADLLIDGLEVAVNSAIANSLWGSGTTGQQFRPPAQEQPTYMTGTGQQVLPASSGYNNFTSATTDIWMADRLPGEPASTGGNTPTWNSITWPLFTDASGNYTFDSPFESSTTMYLAANKGKIIAVPSSRTVDGVNYPAIILYVPGGKITGPNGPINATYLTPNGPSNNAYAFIAASASGDGVADAGLVKVPVGQINGITYYAAVRVIDGNSAINASIANTQGTDQLTNGSPFINFGMFRANVGLQELLSNGDSLSTAQTGAPTSLNAYRFDTTLNANPSNYTDPTVTNAPNNFQWLSFCDEFDSQLTRRPGNPGYGPAKQFIWMGQAATAALAYKFSLVNPNTNPLADPTSIENLLQNELLHYPNSNTVYQNTPYSASQVGTWYMNNFAGLNTYAGTAPNTPLRTVVVGNNAVSNAVPAWYGNASSAPVAWAANVTYHFGDWVVDGPAGSQRSFVCIQQHNSSPSNQPEPPSSYVNPNVPNPSGPTSAGTVGYNAGAIQYWAGAQAPPASALPNPTTSVLPGVPWSNVPVKTSVNTATFEQLYLAFAQVMTDSAVNIVNNVVSNYNPMPAGDIPVLSGNPSQNLWEPPMQPTIRTGHEQQSGQFRSVIRDPRADGAGRVVLTSAQMLKLRAAIAAANTMDLRDSDNDVTSQHIVLTDDAGSPQYDVEVYGTEMQPYISEVIIQTDGTTGVTNTTNNYIAVELCNPYPVPITITNWQIGVVSRAAYPLLNIVQGQTGGLTIPTVTIPAAVGGVPGLLILQDGNQPTDVAATITYNQSKYPVASATGGHLPTSVSGLYLAAVRATNTPNELFIMRPRRYDGQLSKSISPNVDVYDETASNQFAISDFVPVDQLDLTGIQMPTPPKAGGKAPPPYRFLYRRANDSSPTDGVNKAWQFIYPGFYDPASAAPSGRYFNDSTEQVNSAIYQDTTGTRLCNLGGPTGGLAAAAAAPAVAQNDPSSTYLNTCTIELNNTNMAGPNPVAAANNSFPFGAFARNADMLKIPFIGAYRIRPYSATNTPEQTITELNSVTIDSALANDNSGVTAPAPPTGATQVPNNALPWFDNNSNTVPQLFTEQIGRFCPIGDPSSNDPATALDFGQGYANGTTGPAPAKTYWHYHWTKKLFDYLTVQSPQDDYYPNTDPAQAQANVTPLGVAKYPVGVPAPVANGDTTHANAQVAGHSEDAVGVEGLININTASVAVLAQLPFTGSINNPAYPSQAAGNAAIAQAIVNYRNQNGPFTSIEDLYKVQLFRSQSESTLNTAAAGPAQGVFSPGNPGTALSQVNTSSTAPIGVPRFDFQERFLLLNNVSNLVTTRSDTFTCYVLLQGWRNVGTGHPTLTVERRLTFLVDRNGVTPSNNQPVTTKLP